MGGRRYNILGTCTLPTYLMQGTQHASLSRLLLLYSTALLLYFITSSLHHLPTYMYLPT